MNPKDLFLALVLGLAIAHATYEWTSAVGQNLQAWLAPRVENGAPAGAAVTAARQVPLLPRPHFR